MKYVPLVQIINIYQCAFGNFFLIIQIHESSIKKNLSDLNKRFFFEDKNFVLNSNYELTISNYFDDIDCYFKNIKKPVNPDNFYIQKYTFYFQLEFYKIYQNNWIQ